MRSFRDIQAIVRDYPLAPDGEDLRRLCERHFEHLSQPDDVTDWIDHTENPYLRELYATQTALLVKEHCTSDLDTEKWNLPSYVQEDIVENLALIANKALGSQMGESAYWAERIVYSKPQQEAIVQSMPYVQEVNEKLEFMSKRMDNFEEKLEGPRVEIPHWPYFTKEASEDDKRTFENFLLKLCTKETKGISGEIKTFLALKAQAGIIIRPKIIDTELDILRTFGYKSPDKTYYNA